MRCHSKSVWYSICGGPFYWNTGRLSETRGTANAVCSDRNCADRAESGADPDPCHQDSKAHVVLIFSNYHQILQADRFMNNRDKELFITWCQSHVPSGQFCNKLFFPIENFFVSDEPVTIMHFCGAATSCPTSDRV